MPKPSKSAQRKGGKARPSVRKGMSKPGAKKPGPKRK